MTYDMDYLNDTYAFQVGKLQVTPTSDTYNFKYYPDDNEPSIWMYAMISVGSVFVIFVVITLYLMCHSAIRQVGEQETVSRATASRVGTACRTSHSA